MNRLQRLINLGFDNSERRGRKHIKVSCSQCSALLINGVPCHETGCPNQKSECEECGCPIPRDHRLCESCANPEPSPGCRDSPNGRHHFTVDREYDETGETRTCEHCGEIEPTEDQ